MSPRKTKPRSHPRWSMYPALHTDILDLLPSTLPPPTFHPFDDSHTCTRSYDTNIMGRFTCANPSCSSTGWSSMKIAITIRKYRDNEYNARVYHQRCKECDWLSRPELDESYAERVAYRIKKWGGVRMERPVYSMGRGKSNGPHNRKLCEGCKEGHCREGEREWEEEWVV
ncbi:3CxxC-type zinc finger protein [Aspergillus ibericus CBS 121593]|uniref:3CxxC-type domain-containing protein n=1 Tax=Aspergillus ibericus CBS 121593 TaxID=1448316 RepID=A0A395GZ20_9EURO|nr:hypothetical protein BO80DRAFT_475458 [Aspergillus ibericus CBS 121593]RAL00841.1 hypothetical protein BO80DRAFT_475458 [Aspergillus ibericus CBS 121593]